MPMGADGGFELAQLIVFDMKSAWQKFVSISVPVAIRLAIFRESSFCSRNTVCAYMARRSNKFREH